MYKTAFQHVPLCHQLHIIASQQLLSITGSCLPSFPSATKLPSCDPTRSLPSFPHSSSTAGTSHTYSSSASCAATPLEKPAGAAAAETSLELPGGIKIPYTRKLAFTGGLAPAQSNSPTPPVPFSASTPIPCYRTYDNSGRDVAGAEIPYALEHETAMRVYRTLVVLQVMDTIFYDAQRQGRFSFYMSCHGEEATVVGSAAGLKTDDMAFLQYREHGLLLWRGYSLDDFANQLLGNSLGHGLGRQMPIHHGSRKLSVQTVSSPLATQMPHAVGAAYAMKLAGSKNVAACYFGEGAASEGDAHAAFNFAATLSTPVVFICRNNGFAISTPSYEQYRGDGVACRGPSYGIHTIRVDGGDVRAVMNATMEARRLALAGSCPVLIEAMTYRSGHHSTSDDSTRYRASSEIASWRSRDPVARYRAWLVLQGWWDERQEQELRKESRTKVVSALGAASNVAMPTLSQMFTDVYATMPPHLQEQRRETFDFVRRHPGVLPPNIPVE